MERQSCQLSINAVVELGLGFDRYGLGLALRRDIDHLLGLLGLISRNPVINGAHQILVRIVAGLGILTAKIPAIAAKRGLSYGARAAAYSPESFMNRTKRASSPSFSPKGERALLKLDAAENEVRALKAEGLPLATGNTLFPPASAFDLLNPFGLFG